MDFGAPGINVYTTSGTSSYTTTTGTSFSCPLTAGVIGLMYSVPCASFINMVKADPQAGADYVRNALMSNLDPVASMAGISVTGGRLNSFKACNAILTGCSTSSCPQPFGLSVSAVTTNGATLNWTDGGSAAGFYYYYRPSGATTWDSVAVPGTTASLSGLLAPCTVYEVMVAANCGSELSDYSTIQVFTTDGCCTAPTGLSANVLTDSTVSINFAAVTAALSYNVRYKPVSSSTWTTISVTAVPYTLTGLTGCENYEVQVQTVCASTTTAFTPGVLFTTTGCGACEDNSYCVSLGESVDDEYIAGVQVASINRVSGADGGYIFTGLNTTLVRGANYTLTLTPGYTGTAFSEYFMAWIDYNQNGIFENPAERVYTSGSGVTTTVNGNFTVPMTAALGSTRMRVSMKYVGWGDTGTPTPCLEFGYGEVEDYCVSINGTTGITAPVETEVMCMVYPNPAAAAVSFDLYNYQAFEGGQNTITLYNAMGGTVRTASITGKTTTIDLSALSTGIYSYSINFSGKAVRTGRLVVAK